MSLEIVMPRLSDQMEEATIVRWLKAVGDDVVQGEELFEIETDKATWAVEAEASGVLVGVLVPAGETAAIGKTVALIGTRDEFDRAVSAAPTPEPLRAGAEAAAPPEQPTPQPVLARSDGHARHRATPVARRLATELGLSLAHVVGTGPGGRIVRKDVVAAGSTSVPAPAIPEAPRTTGRGEGTTVRMTATRRTIARRMVESTTTIPHFFTSTAIDMESAVAFREELKQLQLDVVPSLNDLVVKAASLALRDHPFANASWDGSGIVLWERINVGIAVATEDALLVPVVADADRKTIVEIATEARELARKVHERTLQPADLADGTFTVSNLGMLGVTSFSAVVNPPQSAILAVGAILQRPVVVDGIVVPRHVMEVTLSSDHRVLYGADAARFLRRLKDVLEHPLALTL